MVRGPSPPDPDSNRAWLRQPPAFFGVPSLRVHSPIRNLTPLNPDSNRAWLRQPPAFSGVPLWHASEVHSQVRISMTGSNAKAPAGGLCIGANYRIRTCDLLITNQLLYQLS